MRREMAYCEANPREVTRAAEVMHKLDQVKRVVSSNMSKVIVIH